MPSNRVSRAGGLDWRVMSGRFSLALVAAGLLCASGASIAQHRSVEPRFSVLVFSKTSGYRHASIPQGVAAIKALGSESGFAVDATEDAAAFNDARLARYRVVIFLSTTGTVLDGEEKAAFERYIRKGGGFVGI